jgi:hypothetical protein
MTNPLRNLFPAAPGYSAPVGSAAALRDLLGRRRTKRGLVNAVRSRLGGGLGDQFRRYVEWLGRHGYTFGSCEDWPLRLDKRRAYLRYDVHVDDLLGAFGLAHLHEVLQIPGSFQVCWEHSLAEVEVADLFLKLQVFDGRFVQFGLHCSPESSWIIAEKCHGRSGGLEQFVSGGAARTMIAKWLAAFERDGDDAPILVEARARAEARLADAAASFRRHFGAAKTVSGHGTPLASAYLDAVRGDPRFAPLGQYLHPVEFLTRERIARHGFLGELTRFDDRDVSAGARIMFENPVADMAERYRRRFDAGGGFVALFHPATWNGDHFRDFVQTVAAPSW